MVSVDGADAVDNSVNGIRSTVSQEAVQEFQMILSNYNAEYGRATGGVVNIVTKAEQRFPWGRVRIFAEQSVPSPKPVFGRSQCRRRLGSGEAGVHPRTDRSDVGWGAEKRQTFYFFSYEYTQREETGFSTIGVGNFGLSPFNCGVGCPLNGLELTSSQSAATLRYCKRRHRPRIQQKQRHCSSWPGAMQH